MFDHIRIGHFLLSIITSANYMNITLPICTRLLSSALSMENTSMVLPTGGN